MRRIGTRRAARPAAHSAATRHDIRTRRSASAIASFSPTRTLDRRDERLLRPLASTSSSSQPLRAPTTPTSSRHSRPWLSCHPRRSTAVNDFAEAGPTPKTSRAFAIAPDRPARFVQSGSHGGVWVKRIWIQRRICKTPAVVSHPRSEPASVIWSFPHQIKLTFGRRVMRPHHNPACGGQGSRGRDHS